jgi:hypothetical protein
MLICLSQSIGTNQFRLPEPAQHLSGTTIANFP